MKKLISIIIVLSLALALLTGCTSTSEKSEDFKIVTSFYPMYTIAKKIAGNIDGVSVSNMAGHNIRVLT